MAAFTLLLIMTELTLCSFNVTGIKREIDQCYVKKLLKEESIDILLLYFTIARNMVIRNTVKHSK